MEEVGGDDRRVGEKGEDGHLATAGRTEQRQDLVDPGEARQELERGITFDEEAQTYTEDPDGADGAPAFSLGNPDFSSRSLRSSLVLRWEYLPGSTLFVVSNHGRSGYSDDPTFHGLRDLDDLLDDTMRNTFVVKVNSWLSR